MADEGNPDGWEVENCYILERMRDVKAIPHLSKGRNEDGIVSYFFGDTCIQARKTEKNGKIRLEPLARNQVACGEWIDLPIDRIYGYCTLLARYLNGEVYS